MEFKRIGDMTHEEPEPERIPGLLDRGLVLLVAPEGSGKTFLAIHMGAHISTGTKWKGERIEQGIVLYCIAEGVSFFPYRVTTALDAIKAKGDDALFYVYPYSLNLRTDEKGKLSPDVERLCDHVAMLEGETGARTKLIVFDTLNRFMPGGDENNQAECGGLVHACEYLKTQLDSTVMLVHHTRKDGKAVRGNTVLSGAADQILIGDKCDSLLESPVLWTTTGFGKRKDRDPVSQWFKYEKVGMSRGNLWLDPDYVEEHDIQAEDQYVLEKKRTDYADGSFEWIATGVVEETLVMTPCESPDESKTLSDNELAVLDLLSKEGPLGVSALIRHTKKAQKTVYAALDRLCEAGKIVKKPGTKLYEVAGNPFEEA